MNSPRAIVLAAPRSSSGKTTVALGLLRHLRNLGIPVRPAKCGPDFIDPQFHEAACGTPSVNLDGWAMPNRYICHLLNTGPKEVSDQMIVIEGAMGVLDGAGQSGAGSSADLAEALDIPLVLIVDATGQGRSAALAPLGLRHSRPSVKLAGVILNRVGSHFHAEQLAAAMNHYGVPVLGMIRNDPTVALPSRHLGLVQPGELEELESFLDVAAEAIGQGIKVDELLSLFEPVPSIAHGSRGSEIRPMGQAIAVANDEAFGFLYPHLMEGWRRQGAELRFFSPLADEAPDASSDAVFLPGGYPELHGSRIANAATFKAGMVQARSRGAAIYGECGGYMVLGKILEDGKGISHEMLGLLPHSVSIARPKRRLGYRILQSLEGSPFSGTYHGHEFHYASSETSNGVAGLFDARDSMERALPRMGHVSGNVSGSFAHLICAAG